MSSSRAQKQALAAALLFLLPLLAWSWAQEWWAPDEPRYAQIAREAYESGSLVVLHLNGELYPDKPPLLYWLAGWVGSWTGWSEFAMRWPSFAALAGMAWLLWRMAQRFFGDESVLWAPLMLLVMGGTIAFGPRLQLDPLLSCLVLFAIERFSKGLVGERVSGLDLCLAGLALGLGALVKGPVAWLHAGLALVAMLAMPRGSRGLSVRPWWGWVGCVLLMLAPVALWAFYAIALDERLREPLLFGQHLGRVAEGTQHRGPPWDHLVDLSYLLLPWTPLVVAGIVRAWRERRTAPSPRTWLALWFLLTFVVFSIIPVKRALYLMPIYPAAALLAASELACLARSGQHSRWLSRPVPLLLGLAGAAALAFAPWHAELAGLRWAVGCLGVLLLGGAWLAWRQAQDLRSQASVLAVTVALSVLVGALTVVPALNPLKSARLVAQYLAQRPEKPTRISCLGVQPEGYRFYAKIPASKEDFEPALQREGAQFLGLARESDYEKLPAALRERMTVLHRAQVGSRDLVVVGAKLP